jgi:hypothetical protein
VLLALARGRTQTDAAQAGDVSERTVRRWLEDPEFRAEVTALRGELLDRTVGGLVDAAGDAVATLRRALDSDDVVVQVRAARAILHALITVRESADLEARIAALEATDPLGKDAP